MRPSSETCATRPRAHAVSSPSIGWKPYTTGLKNPIHSVADGVNVGYEVYRIRTWVGEQGSVVVPAAGVIEARPAGTTLSGVAEQSDPLPGLSHVFDLTHCCDRSWKP